MKEIWKDIIGYEGLYSVSNTGLVKRVTTNKIKKPSLNSWGYEVVSLSKPNTKLKTILVHRLVAIHFINNPESKKQVNHIDGIKTNNNVSNLEWNTTKENLEHKRINNLGKTLKAKLSATGINNSQAKLDEEDVIFIRTNCETKIDIKKFSKELNVSIATIYDIKNRRSWTHI